MGAQDIQDIGSANVNGSVTWELNNDEARIVRVVGPAEAAALFNPRLPDKTKYSLEKSKPTEIYSTNRNDMIRETWSSDGVNKEYKKEFVQRDGNATEYNASLSGKSGFAKNGIDIEIAGTSENGLNDTTTLIQEPRQ